MSNDETWQPARLIPVSGLSNTNEQERRGASALLAVMQSVKEYGRAVLQKVGAPAGLIETYIEVPFEIEGVKYRPDGLIRVTRGATTWTALVEVKTGRDKLLENQIKAYIEIARAEGFDAVISISNELATMGGLHPLSIDRRLTRKVALHHISWSLLHAEALIERVNQSVAVTEQAWILSEFIRYLEYPKSGAVDFDDMGPYWVQVRDAAVASTLRANDQSTHEVVDRFSQLTRYVAMNLSSQLGVQVRRVLTKQDRNNPTAFIQSGSDELAATGRMKGSISVPNAASPIDITVDLRAGRVSCTVTLVAPGQGKPKTRVSWLLRQLKGMPADLLLTANGPRARDVGPALRLDKVADNPDQLLPDSKFDVRSFSLSLSSVAGSKRGQGKGSFVGSVIELVNRFYEVVVQDLKPWSPPAPKVTSIPVVPTSQGGQPVEIPPSLAGVMPETAVPETMLEIPRESAEVTKAGESQNDTEQT
jgi:hypothetical protein